MLTQITQTYDYDYHNQNYFLGGSNKFQDTIFENNKTF